MENNNIQPEYLNPQSDKYYKGFRYEKDEDGDEFWCDGYDVCKKEIFYHDNGNKASECYYNEEGEFHNEEGYAYQYWYKNGDIHSQMYHLNGRYLTEEEWKEKTGKIDITIEYLFCNMVMEELNLKDKPATAYKFTEKIFEKFNVTLK